MTTYTFTYQLTSDIRKRHYRSELLRTQSPWLITMVLLVPLSFWMMTDSEPAFRWFAGIVQGAAIVYVGVLRAAYASLMKRDWSEVSVSLDEEGVHSKHPTGSSDLRWNGIISARRSRIGVALTPRITRNAIVLPASALSADAAEFILSRVAAAGGKVFK